MNRGILHRIVAGLGLTWALATAAPAQFTLDLEGAWVRPDRLDVRIPSDGGTDLSFTDDLDADDTAAFRGRLSWRFAERHSVFALAAPLEVEASGVAAEDVRFKDGTFPAGTPLKGTYRFDSYRVGYRYLLWRREDLRFELGATAKIRDAAIGLEGGGQSQEDSNLGLVPLLSFRLEWDVTPSARLVLDGDALAAPQGRAEDVFAGLQWDLAPSTALDVGYRILEGGADNDDVYTFALFHYAVAGLTFRF